MGKPRCVFAGPCGLFAVLLGLVSTLSTPALADPPVLPPMTAAPAPPLAPNAVSVTPPPLNAGQQKAARMEAQRLSLHRLAQTTEREATRLARARQFDKAQRLYAQAASLYHQQARLARRSAQDRAHAGQMSLAARIHAEALAADNRFLACLASEVSAIKKSSLAEALPPTPLLSPKPKKPVRVLPQASLPAPVPARLPAKTSPKPVALKPLTPRIPLKPLTPRVAVLPPSAPKQRPKAKLRPTAAGVKSAPQLLHVARARKVLPPALKALRQAAVRPLDFAPQLIAAQQHGLLQERLRLRRAQLLEAGSGDAVPPAPAQPASP